jgi:hypothetical protein
MTDDIKKPILGRFQRDHDHRWYMAQTRKDFEPTDEAAGHTLYEMVEYAYLVCNCGEAIRTRVKTKEELESQL